MLRLSRPGKPYLDRHKFVRLVLHDHGIPGHGFPIFGLRDRVFVPSDRATDVLQTTAKAKGLAHHSLSVGQRSTGAMQLLSRCDCSMQGEYNAETSGA